MTESSGLPDAEDTTRDDTVREHSQDPAEGIPDDEDAAAGNDVPREHPQDPAEG
jgi:hypothetical protein